MRALLVAALLMVGCGAQAVPPSAEAAREAATREARRTFPEFRKRFEARQDEGFFVSLPFETREHYTEEMWVRLTKLSGDSLEGVLENQPLNPGTLKQGDPVQSEVARINDWYIADAQGKRIAGGYTLKLLEE